MGQIMCKYSNILSIKEIYGCTRKWLFLDKICSITDIILPMIISYRMCTFIKFYHIYIRNLYVYTMDDQSTLPQLFMLRSLHIVITEWENISIKFSLRWIFETLFLIY